MLDFAASKPIAAASNRIDETQMLDNAANPSSIAWPWIYEI